MVNWDDDDYDNGMHAALSYDVVASAGPAARPLEFPNPTVYRGSRQSMMALDHRTGRIHSVNNVLMRLKNPSIDEDERPPNRAYLIKKRLSRTIYGVVRLCVVLRRRRVHATKSNPARRRREHGMIRDEDVEWESTEELCVVKVSSWQRMHQLRGRHLEDPIKEISAAQLVGNYSPNILGTIEVLQDDDYLYTVMPYCSGGDLFGRIMGTEKARHESQHSSMSDRTFDHAGVQIEEGQARVWFRQLLSALFHLQRKGVCHRDLSLENIMVDDEDLLKVIDLGMSLRVPYADPNGLESVTDVSEGTERVLMKAQGQGGKLMYLAPELVARDDVFDGFATDLWAAGVVLFVMLVGLAPFKWAHESDKRYAKIARGSLKELMGGLKMHLSDEACDLLQNMFWRDPHKRLTLAQVMQHPWVLGKKFSVPAVSSKGSRVRNQQLWHRALTSA